MVIDWFRFLLRQLATALVVVTSILLISEILMPASILPYFNLHILVLVTLIIAVASPMIEEKSRVMRYALCATLSTLLLAYAWLMFGTSTSGLALFVALTILIVGVTIALCHPAKGDRLHEEESGGPTPAAWGTRTPLSDSVRLLPLSGENVVEETVETITITADGIEIDETSVFMR
ncbi:hypothetical protein K8R04_02985 [Candidatus Uhrbacteria bacterium]|nr:hypothetical protein [Candidatus Uhrbacteria bacterium]